MTWRYISGMAAASAVKGGINISVACGISSNNLALAAAAAAASAKMASSGWRGSWRITSIWHGGGSSVSENHRKR